MQSFFTALCSVRHSLLILLTLDVTHAGMYATYHQGYYIIEMGTLYISLPIYIILKNSFPELPQAIS